MKEKITILLIVIIVAILAEIDGYTRAHNKIKIAHQKQIANDKSEIVKIQEKKTERKKHYDDSKKIIQAISDPSGCVHRPVPGQRVERLYNLYSSTTRSGTD